MSTLSELSKEIRGCILPLLDNRPIVEKAQLERWADALDAMLKAASKTDLVQTCARCQEEKECLWIETGFAGETEPLCADCISAERAAQAPSEPSDARLSQVEGIVFAKENGIAFINLPRHKQIWVPSKGVRVGDKLLITVQLLDREARRCWKVRGR